MGRKGTRVSLFTYAIVLTLPVGIALLAATWLISSSLLHKAVESQLHEQMVDSGSAEATRIQTKLQDLKQFAKTLAGNGLIINGMIDTEGRGDYLPIFFRSLTPPISSVATVHLVDYKGRAIIASHGDRPAPLLPPTTEFSETIILDESGLIVIEPVVIHSSVEGAIILHYPTSTFNSLFDTLSQRHSFYLVNENNIVAFSDNPDLASAGKPAPEISTEDWLQIRNEVPQSNLSVVIVSSLKVAFKSLETVQRVQTIGLVIFLAITIGLVLMAVAIVSRPLKKMTIGISEIKSTSDLGRQLDTKGPREIADIASTFNRLGSRLRSTTVSRDYMDNILKSITEGILTIDQQGDITTSNRAATRIFGYHDNQLIGQNLSSLLTQNGQDSYQPFIEKEENGEQVGEVEAYKADGSVFPIDLIVTALSTDDSKAKVCTIRDITERKLIEQQLQKQTQELERANSDLERFVFVASHDLKAPLRGIDNLVTWIGEDIAEVITEETQENMVLVHRRVQRMENLLDGLLEYARVGSNKMQPVSVDTRALVLDIVDLLSPSETFSIEISAPMPELTTEVVSLEQVFRNLINNAIKHHDLAEGIIIVSAKVEGDLYHFTVADDGPGIGAEFHERIFTMFQTLKSRDEVEGSGMGLAMVKKEVELHGGNVWVESNPEERGAAFHFTWHSNND